jgi:hypothetical protein
MQYELEFDGAHPLAGTPALQYTITAAGPHASWVRVDGWSIWYPARAPAETAPTTGTVVISLSSGPMRTVTDPAVVRRLATEFNGLLRTTPGRRYGRNCNVGERSLAISFVGQGATVPAIAATLSGCSIVWGVRGPSGDLPGLEDGGNLLSDALRLLGVSPNALFVPAPTPVPSAGG